MPLAAGVVDACSGESNDAPPATEIDVVLLKGGWGVNMDDDGAVAEEVCDAVTAARSHKSAACSASWLRP